jgi:hypothetical protein
MVGVPHFPRTFGPIITGAFPSVPDRSQVSIIVFMMELRREVKELMRASQSLIESIHHSDKALNMDERAAVLYHLQELGRQIVPESASPERESSPAK